VPNQGLEHRASRTAARPWPSRCSSPTRCRVTRHSSSARWAQRDAAHGRDRVDHRAAGRQLQ